MHSCMPALQEWFPQLQDSSCWQPPDKPKLVGYAMKLNLVSPFGRLMSGKAHVLTLLRLPMNQMYSVLNMVCLTFIGLTPGC